MTTTNPTQKLTEIYDLARNLRPASSDFVVCVTAIRKTDVDGAIRFMRLNDRMVSGASYWVLRWLSGTPRVLTWNASLEGDGRMRYGGKGNLLLNIDLSQPPVHTEHDAKRRPDALLSTFRPTLEICVRLLRAVRTGRAGTLPKPAIPTLFGLWPDSASLAPNMGVLTQRVLSSVMFGYPLLSCLCSFYSGRVTSVVDDGVDNPRVTIVSATGDVYEQVLPKKAILRRDLVCMPDMATGDLDICVEIGSPLATLPSYPRANPEVLHTVWGNAFQELLDMEFRSSFFRVPTTNQLTAPAELVVNSAVGWEERYEGVSTALPVRWISQPFVGSAASLMTDNMDLITLSTDSPVSRRVIDSAQLERV